MKKLISLLICLMLLASLAVPALAETTEPTTTITITTGAPNSEFALYRILTASNSGDAYGYGTNEKYDPIYQELFSSADDSVVVGEFNKMATEADARAFAVRLHDAITGYNQKVTNNEITGTAILPDETIKLDPSGNGSVTVPQGYYLIVETKLGNYTDGSTDTYSLYMMDTAGDSGLEIETKESVPTLEKKVYETNTSKNDANHNYWDEHASYDIGDSIEYRINVSVSGSYEGYKSYYVSVEDTMDPGLVYNGDLSVHIGNGDNGPDITDFFTIDQSFADENGKKGFKASADLKDVTYEVVVDGETQTHKVDHNTDIVFKYTATLNGVDDQGNSQVVVGANGNKNTAKLIYQNNPYVDVDPKDPKDEDLGETPEDINVVFTFKTIVNKVDPEGQPVTGAGFTLYKFDDVTTHSFLPVGEELVGGDLITFTFNGLDEGIYKLVETTVPVGRNKADDIEFHIHAEYDDCDPGCLIGLKAVTATGGVLGEATFNPHANTAPENVETQSTHPFSVTLDGTHADLATSIVNRSGRELPHTGGMGTTVLYIAGGILVLAAVVLLVTKKRMSNSD